MTTAVAATATTATGTATTVTATATSFVVTDITLPRTGNNVGSTTGFGAGGVIVGFVALRFDRRPDDQTSSLDENLIRSHQIASEFSDPPVARL